MGDGASARSVFGRYELIRELATGGMGRIFLARQSGIEGFSRICVLKRIRGELADSDLATLLIDEARIAANLNHPNIAAVYDFGRHDDELFLSMEYVPGPNLDALVHRARDAGKELKRDVILYIAGEVARGLAFAHDSAQKVVHRDISPQNVLLSIHGEVKITDFGIAKAVDRLHRSTTGEVRGKIQYMAPEQLAGKPVDRRADIFALGVILWELVLGRPLWTGGTIDAVIEKRMAGPIPQPRVVDRTVPEDLSAVIMASLAKREQRIASAAELAERLGQCADAKPVSRDQVGALVRDLFPDIGEHGPSSPSGPLPHAMTELAAGMSIGEFEIVGILGEGASGVVYDAINPLIGKRAAIKVLREPRAGDDAVVARFLTEARAVNEIDHPGIIDIFAFGTLPDGRPYCAMDRLEGETLAAALRRGPMAIERALDILGEIAAAIDAAHARGIYHRDLKPENVFLTDGGVRVLDFGLAKLRRGSLGATQSGVMVGTPLYMSPEQASGADIDHRSDVFSFGVVAFKMLTTESPFSGDRPLDAVAARFTSEPRRLSAFGHATELDAVIGRCLAKDPADRFNSTGEAHRALTDAQLGSKRRRARRIGLLAAAGLIATLGLGATIALAAGGDGSEEASADAGVATVLLDAAPRVDATARTADIRDVAAGLRQRREALKRSLVRRIEHELEAACRSRGLTIMPREVEVFVRPRRVGVADVRVTRPDSVRGCGYEEVRDKKLTEELLKYKPTLRLRYKQRDPDAGAKVPEPRPTVITLDVDAQKRGYLQNVINTECALDGDGPWGVMTLRFETDGDAKAKTASLSKKSTPAFAMCVARSIASRAGLEPDAKYRWRLSIAKGRKQMERERRAREVQ